MRRIAALLLATPLLAGGLARADRWELADGSTVTGAPVGSADGHLLVLTAEGERTLEAGDVVAHAAEPVEPGLQKKAEKARAAFLARRGREARALLKKHARAKDDDARAALAAELDGVDPEALLEPLEGALEEKDEPTRALALARLQALPLPEATDALLRAAMSSRQPAVRQAAHQAAVARDAERARLVYEAVLGSPQKPSRRAYALQHLDALGVRDSIPGLIVAVEKISQETRAALATAGPMRQVPVNLGTSGAAATQVPIDLPEMQLIEVQTSNTVTVLRVLGEGSRRLLRKLSGTDQGEDPAAWRRWWDQESQRAGSPGSR